jgi:hypothetical protein
VASSSGRDSLPCTALARSLVASASHRDRPAPLRAVCVVARPTSCVRSASWLVESLPLASVTEPLLRREALALQAFRSIPAGIALLLLHVALRPLYGLLLVSAAMLGGAVGVFALSAWHVRELRRVLRPPGAVLGVRGRFDFEAALDRTSSWIDSEIRANLALGAARRRAWGRVQSFIDCQRRAPRRASRLTTRSRRIRSRARSPGRPSGDDDPPSRPPLAARRKAGS